MLIRTATLISLTLALVAAVHAQPTISGTSAFWYLGTQPSGVYSDGGACSPPNSGPCYYTQTVLTASPNGGPLFSWSVSNTGAGSVTLSCSSGCSNSVTVTATHASSGCSADVSVSVSYNGGAWSAGYGLTIVTPASTLLYSGPSDGDPGGAGSFETDYSWLLYDSCGNNDTGIDQTEAFGSWTDDFYASHGVHNNWTNPLATGAYATSLLLDAMTHGGGNTFTPAVFSPQSPPCTVSVEHAPWTLYAGSKQPTDCGGAACGAAVLSDSFQYYSDCGRHQ